MFRKEASTRLLRFYGRGFWLEILELRGLKRFTKLGTWDMRFWSFKGGVAEPSGCNFGVSIERASLYRLVSFEKQL